MTETPQQTDRPVGEEQTTGPEPSATSQPGVDRGHLRNYEQLRRSVTDRKVAGVAGGLGRHLNVDPTILRVLFVVLCFFGGAGFLLYGVAWLMVPEEGRREGRAARIDDSTRNVVLIVVGVVAALLVLGDSWGGVSFPWPLPLLVVGGLVYLVLRDRGRTAGPGTTSSQTSGPAMPPPGAGHQVEESTGFAYPAADQHYVDQPPAPPWEPPTAGGAAYRRPKPAKRGPKLFGFTLAAVLLALGCLGLYDVAGGHVVATAYPALALAVVGIMLVVGAFVGRAGGLVALGVLAVLALVGTSVGSTVDGIDGSTADRITRTPATAADVSAHYEITTGRILLDLSKLQDPAALDGRNVSVTGRVGELVVVLPPGVHTQVTSHIGGPGAIDYPDNQTGGIGNNLDGSYGTGPTALFLRLDLRAGHIEVRNP